MLSEPSRKPRCLVLRRFCRTYNQIVKRMPPITTIGITESMYRVSKRDAKCFGRIGISPIPTAIFAAALLLESSASPSPSFVAAEEGVWFASPYGSDDAVAEAADLVELAVAIEKLEGLKGHEDWLLLILPNLEIAENCSASLREGVEGSRNSRIGHGKSPVIVVRINPIR